jgi:hypothetical protein
VVEIGPGKIELVPNFLNEDTIKTALWAYGKNTHTSPDASVL